MSEPTSFPAAVPISLRALVEGPLRVGRIVAAFPTTVYVDVVDDQGRATLLAVVTSDAVALPNALVLAGSSRSRLLRGLAAGDVATVGEGTVACAGRVVVTVGRWVDRRVRLTPTTTTTLARSAHALNAARSARTGSLTEPLGSRVAWLGRTLADRDLPALAAAAQALVGLGPGLTPAGDDVLAGVLAAGRAFATAVSDPGLDTLLVALWNVLDDGLADRTTGLSAALLHHAARAEMAEPARALVVAAAAGRPLDEPLGRLLAVGQTSGRDLTVGIELAARAAAASGGHIAPRPSLVHPGALR